MPRSGARASRRSTSSGSCRGRSRPTRPAGTRAETDPLMTALGPPVPDDHRDRGGRGVGVDGARPGHGRRPLRRPARPDGGRRRGGAAGGDRGRLCRRRRSCATTRRPSRSPAAGSGRRACPSDHPLPVGLADVAERVTGRRPALLGEPYGADMQMFVNVGQDAVRHLRPGRRQGRAQRRRARAARRGRDLRPRARGLAAPGADRRLTRGSVAATCPRTERRSVGPASARPARRSSRRR